MCLSLSYRFDHFPFVVLHGFNGEFMGRVEQMNHRVVRTSFGIVLLRIPHVGQHQMTIEKKREVPLLLCSDLTLTSRFSDRDQRRNIQDRRYSRIFFTYTDAVRIESMLQCANLNKERTLINTTSSTSKS